MFLVNEKRMLQFPTRLNHFVRDLHHFRFRNGPGRPPLEQDALALVTGGSRGLGFHIVRRLASYGVTVINVDLVPPTCKFEESDKIHYYSCDITDHDEVKSLHEKILRDHGTVTILINNAGITRIKSLEAMTDDEIKAVLNVNLVGAYVMMNSFLPGMIAEMHGFIVNIASVLGEVTPARLTSYGASKGGLIAAHNSLANALKKPDYGSGAIKMLLVCPGKINTAMFEKVETPSKLFAPDIDPSKLADYIVTAIRLNSTVTLRFPYYVNILPFIKQLSWPYMRLLKRCSGMDKATAVPCPSITVSSHDQ